MGDGKTRGLSAAARGSRPTAACVTPRPAGHVHPKQGDAMDIHDGAWISRPPAWSSGRLLLIGRDQRRSAITCPSWSGRPISSKPTRPKNNLFLAGAAGNLLAPSHAGWKRPDGKFEQAYLVGLSITYIAGLDRLIELEKIAHVPRRK